MDSGKKMEDRESSDSEMLLGRMKTGYGENSWRQATRAGTPRTCEEVMKQGAASRRRALNQFSPKYIKM